VIYGERTRLRGVERQDLPRFQAWLNDPEVRIGMTLFQPLSMVQEERWFEGLQDRPIEEHPLAIEVAQGESWTTIGNCGLIAIDWRVRAAEFGIFIGDKAYWSKGYGTEVTRLMLQHSFQALNLNRLFLRVFADNLRAQRAYEKAGFVLEGRLREAEYHAGAYVDVIVMSVLASEWMDRDMRAPGAA
jgi:RimJ/RimL family protein N-acetyltransferase